MNPLSYFFNNQIIPMSDEDIDKFRLAGKSMELTKGSIFLDYGESATKIAFVISGLLEMSINVNDNEKIIEFITPQTCAVDFLGYLLEKPSDLQIKATLDSHVLSFNKKDLQSLLANDDKYKKVEHYIIEQSHLEFIQRLRWMYLSPKERYDDFRKRHPDLIQQVPQYKIASFLNVTPEWLSKIRSSK